MPKWGELPPTVQWLVGIGAAIITLCAAWDRGLEMFASLRAGQERHEMVDRDVPKVHTLEQAVQELKKANDQSATATKALQTWATKEVTTQVAQCDAGITSEILCVGVYERNGLPNTYGSKALPSVAAPMEEE